MSALKDCLCAYSQSLVDALMQLKNPRERDMVVDHLAMAANMKRMLWDKKPIDELKILIEKQNRNHCSYYISGNAAENISHCWQALLKQVETDQQSHE